MAQRKHHNVAVFSPTESIHSFYRQFADASDSNARTNVVCAFFAAFSNTKDWDVPTRAPYVFATGLILRRADATLRQHVLKEYASRLPDWLAPGAMWYANTPETSKLLESMTKKSWRSEGMRLRAKLYQRRPAPLAAPSHALNAILENDEHPNGQFAMEQWAHWYVLGAHDVLEELLPLALPAEIRTAFRKVIEESDNSKATTDQLPAVDDNNVHYENLLSSLRYDAEMQQTVIAWLDRVDQ